jgi:tetratricopeptide (TPR) repeat protein
MAEPTQWRTPLPKTGEWGGPGDPARRLWGLWREGQKPGVGEYVATAGVGDPEQILAVLRVDQAERFRDGQWVRAESYFEAFPAVRDDAERAVDFIFSEYLLREENGDQPAVEEYAERFPDHADELKLQIELHRAMVTRDGPATSFIPGGETLFDTRMRESGVALDVPPEIPGFEVGGILGRGGMAVVYRAWQQELNRPVALKMVHAGAVASNALQARFRIEAEAIARLRHPNIVQIHGVDQHKGALVLILELVEGQNLARRIAGTPQPVAWSATLVETVARAIHAAHQQGVVHRDLTPANILLTADDAPKITDFGLAKLMKGGSDLRSQTGELLGTPSYMAPEQAASRHEAIGATTDVYALGAILYELLAGRPPFKAESPLETLRQVISAEPVPPSRLRPNLARDLETICLKCLQKEPAHRYGGALDVALDLRRFLESRPIQARRSGAAERAWRFCRRNPAVASLLALVIVLCCTMAIGSTVAAFWLKRSRDEAFLERNRAEANFLEARHAVDDSFTKVSESVLLNAPGLQPLRRQLLQDALRYYRGFVERLRGQTSAQADLAAALARMAKITAEIGSKEQALGFASQSRGIHEALAAAAPSSARLQRELARSIAAVANLRAETSQRDDAVAEYRKALALQQALVAANPGDIEAHNDLAATESGLGFVLEPLGRAREAGECYERALAIRERLTTAFPDDPRFGNDLARDHNRIGGLHRAANRRDEAIRAYRQAIKIQEALVASYPDVAVYRSSLARSYRLLGVCQRETNQLDLALATYDKARRAQESLVAANPSVNEYRNELGDTFNSIANIERARGDLDESLRFHRRALQLRKELVAANPRVVRYQIALGGSYNAIARIQTERGRRQDALKTFADFRDQMIDVLKGDTANSDARFWLSSAWHNTGLVLAELGRTAEAVAAFRNAIEEKRRALATGPKSKARIRSLGNHHLALAEAQRALGLPAEAAKTLWDNRQIWASDPDGLYDLACGLAACIAPSGGDARGRGAIEHLTGDQGNHADRAIEALEQAADAGFRDAARLCGDKVLAPLRSRDDFQALVNRLAFPRDPFAP